MDWDRIGLNFGITYSSVNQRRDEWISVEFGERVLRVGSVGKRVGSERKSDYEWIVEIVV